MSDIVERLRAHGSKTEMEAADEIERLRANQERMWCKSCGTITRDSTCDCTRMGTGTQNLVNYADDTNERAHDLMMEIERQAGTGEER